MSDLAVGETVEIGYTVDLGESGTVVGNTLVDDAHAAVNSDPRELPEFGADGLPLPGSYTEAASSSAATAIRAIEITKAEPSPEGELLRGVHDHRTTYTLQVRSAPEGNTTDVTVTDYLPAGMEFLGCGDEDNTQPGSQVEYPGAPRLGVPAVDPPDCLQPASVETVVNPPPDGDQDYPPGVYTKVTWELGTVTNTPTTIRYVAGIPLRRNTMSWDGPTPSPGSGNQGSNLGNNNGPSTREDDTEETLTNYARTAGTYQGPIEGPADVSDEATESVTVEDVRMRKSVTPETFDSTSGDNVATYSIVVDTSEYVTASGITVTDAVPDGLCPLGMGIAECGAGGAAPSHPVSSATRNSDGTTTVVFEPLAGMGENDTATVTFDAKMMPTYTGTHAGEPTASGDSFTNDVELTGGTTPIPGTGESGDVLVGDSSSATQSTRAPTLSKTMKPRPIGAPTDFPDPNDYCTENLGQYGKPGDPGFDDPRQYTFRKGDRVCFKLRVDFPDSVRTRNVSVADYLPPDTEAIDPPIYVPTSANTVLSTFSTGPRGRLSWELGTSAGDARYVEAGAVFEVTVSARVTQAPPPPTPDLMANLMKMTSENTEGVPTSDRDTVDFDLAPAANVELTKGVYEVDDPAQGPFPPNQDGKLVDGLSTATFRVDVTNRGRQGFPGASFSVRGLQTYDVLAAGMTCADVGNYRWTRTTDPSASLSPQPFPAPLSNYVNCYDPGDPDRPNIAPAYGTASQSVIVWKLPVSDAWAINATPQVQTMTLLYDVAIPDGASVSQRFDNQAGVRSFDSFTNEFNVATSYYPDDNIDQDVVEADLEDAQAADDPSWVRMVAVGLTKTAATSIVQPNNNLLTQATIGEDVTYTVQATVPAHTSVYNGVLTDTLPPNFTFRSASAGISTTGGPPFGPLPAEFGFDTGTGQVTFPASYVNDTENPHVIQVTITARVANVGGPPPGGNVHGRTKTNTARFTSNLSDGGDPVAPVTASVNTTIVEPSPTLTKTPSANPVIANQLVDYTLRLSNANGRPPSHRTAVTDCVNANLIYVQVVSNNGGAVTTEPGTGPPPAGNGCAVGTTKLSWAAGSVLTGAVSQKVLVYRTRVIPNVAGGITIPNTATGAGHSLDDADLNDQDRPYPITANASIDTVTSGVVKAVNPDPATIGEHVTYTAGFSLPAGTSFFNLSAIDTLPAGLDPNVTDVTVTCVDEDGADCTETPPFTTLTPDGQKIGWLLGDYLDSGKDRTITLTFRTVVLNVPGNLRGTTLTNAIGSRWDNVPGLPAPTSVNHAFQNPGSNDTVDLHLVEPNVQIFKGVDDPTPGPGETFTYIVTVSNPTTAGGTSPAYDVAVTDCVPAGVVVDGDSISHGGTLGPATPECGGGVISWSNLGPIEVDGSMPLTYEARLGPSEQLTGDPLVNTVAVPSFWSLSDQPGNEQRREYTGPEAPATVTPAFPFVEAAKSTPNGDLAYLGEPFTWQVELTNTGGAQAFNVDAVDVLPNNWTYVEDSAQVTVPGQPTEQINPVISEDPGPPLVQTLTWSDIGSLAADPDQPIVITFDAIPAAAAADNPGVGHSVPHTNTVTPNALDATGASGNASGGYSGGPATAEAFIDSADLQLTKSHDDGVPWIAGGQGSWQIVVENNGPDASVGPYVVRDSLPEGLDYVSAGGGTGGTAWACTLLGDERTIECVNTNGGDPLPLDGQLPDIVITVGIPADTLDGTEFDNAATVTGQTFDPDPDNNTDDDRVTVQAEADIAITKTTTSEVVAGQPITYQLVVDNLIGPSDSQPDITVTDTLPASLANGVASGDGWDCTVTGQAISCVRDTVLAFGATAPAITVTADVRPGTTGSIVNTAVVTPTTADPDSDNNTSTVTDPVGTSADLTLLKTHESDEPDDELVPGSSGSYVLRVGNNGPSTAQPDITITDTLPVGLTYTGFTERDGQWECSVLGQAVTCTLVDGAGAPTALAPGETPAVVINFDIAADVVGDIENCANVTSPTDPSGASGCDDTASTKSVDLAIVKSHEGTVVAGEELEFTLAVTNNGPSNSGQPIVVKDVLDEAYDFVDAVGTNWDCDYDADTREVECIREAGAAADDSLPDITLTVDVDPSAGPGTIPNTATVTGPDPDPDLDNNTSTDPVVVTALTNLVLTKVTEDPQTVTAGENATFTVTVENEGPSTARSVTVTDTLPAGMTLVSASGTGWNCTGLVCSRDALAPGFAPDITIVARVSPSVPDGTTLENSATVTTSTTQSSTDDDTDTSDVDVVAEADLALTKSHTGGPFAAGEQVTYTMAVRNNGPSDAVAPVRVVDRLPVGLTYVSAQTGWTCAADPVDNNGQRVECTLDSGGLAAGADAPDLVMLVQIGADSVGGELENAATVTSPTDDPDPDNNTDDDTITVDRQADLAITKTHSGTVAVGQDVTFRLSVTNLGPSTAQQVEVSDTFPAGLTPKQASGTGWDCDVAGQRVTCTTDTLGDGEADPISVTATVGASAYPETENTATVTSVTPDPDPDNNKDTDEITVPPLVDLAITKSHEGDWQAGEQAVFTMVVSNNGPTADPGPLRVTDTLPAGLEYVSMVGSGFECAAEGRRVRCTSAAGLAVDGKVTLRLTVNVLAAAAPSALNTVSVTSDATDVDPDNNTAEDRVTVKPQVMLSGSKEVLDAAGDAVTWRITVRNDGLSPTDQPITVVDTLPPALAFQTFAGEGWDCNAAGRVVTCTYDSMLAAGAATHVDLTTTFTGGERAVTNTAVISGGGGDGDIDVTAVVDRHGGGDGPGRSGGGGVPAVTGADSARLALWGLALLLVGVALTRAARRRTR